MRPNYQPLDEIDQSFSHSGARDVEVDLIWDRLRFWIPFGRWYLQKLRIVPFKQLLSSFCDDETMPATTSPLLSSRSCSFFISFSFRGYDFPFSLSSGSLWLAFSQPLCGSFRDAQQQSIECSAVFQLAAHPPFPASDKGWGKELGQVLLNP
ncbi:hypothetical protein Prudu_1318S000100, partial [Prunus dulcis]